MADKDPIQDRQDRNVEVPGDTDSADIVDRTGEQMPRQSHDGLEAEERKPSTRVNDEDKDPVREERQETGNPRTGPVH
jgi:hypothetical protein